MNGFPAAQAARLGGCTRSQLRHWATSGVVTPSDAGRYSFRDLVALRVVASLLDAGLPMARVRSALAVLTRSGDDLAGLRIVTDGVSVFACYDDGQILDALGNGQLALFVAVDRFAAALDADIEAFTAERDAFLTRLQTGSNGDDSEHDDSEHGDSDRDDSDRDDSDRDDGEPVVGRGVVAQVGIAR